MTLGGDGIPGIKTPAEPDRSKVKTPFVYRRFKVGGGVNVADSQRVVKIRTNTCVLCGGPISEGDGNNEHVLPRWLHRLAEEAGERPSSALLSFEGRAPTWRQLELAAHKNCNTRFAEFVENPALTAVTDMVAGKRVTHEQIEAVLDWLDKLRSSAAHMATAFSGHKVSLNYNIHSFANQRIGLFDRIAAFFRIDKYREPLDIWDCENIGFISTPSALALRIKDLIILTASDNYMLSEAFGLVDARLHHGEMWMFGRDGKFADGFGFRTSRLGFASVIAQPMRRQHFKEMDHPTSPALRENGDGHIFHLESGKWRRTRSLDFSTLKVVPTALGHNLVGLETIEWLIWAKEDHYERAGRPANFFAMKSLPQLKVLKLNQLECIAADRGGLRVPESDRF